MENRLHARRLPSSRRDSFKKETSNPFTIRKRGSEQKSAGRNQDNREDTRAGSYGSGQFPDELTLEEKLARLGIELGATTTTPSSTSASPGVQAPGRYNFQVASPSVVSLQGIEPPVTGHGNLSARNSTENDTLSLSRESSDLSESERKSARLSADLSRRISGISSSMNEFGKKVRNVEETMQEAYRKSIQDQRRRSSSSRNASPSPSGDDPMDSAEQFLLKSQDKFLLSASQTSLNVPSPGPGGDNNEAFNLNNNVNSSPRKVFGLDSMALLKSSSSSSSSTEETADEDDEEKTESSEESDSDTSGPVKMRISIRHPQAKAKAAALKRFQEKAKPPLQRPSRPKAKPRVLEEEKIRSLSPIMPTLPDKQFQSILERREERVSRQLTTMKNELAQLNQKVELDKRKVSGKASPSPNITSNSRFGVMDTSYQGRPMRLMKSQPDTNAGNEFSEFLQSTGGRSGGWQRQDHNVFLKTFDIWRKHPNKLMEALKKELPEKKPKDIGSHIKWFERFEQLSKQNRQDVHKWAQEKRKENELVLQMGSESQRAKLEGDKRRQEHLRMVRDQERDKGKEKLAQWKRTQSVRCQTATNVQTPAEQSVDDQQTTIDIPGIRKHILEITQKVHALENPKRDFRPPRPTGVSGRQPTFSRSFTQIPTASHVGMGLGMEASAARYARQSSATTSAAAGDKVDQVNALRGRMRLPEIDPDPLQSLRSSRPSSRHSSLQMQRNRVAEFRERDARIVEAKKKAIEIARQRRKSNLSELTPEEVRRRIRSRTGGPSSILNPTKQSEMRKSLTHLERLEMLSKQDLTKLTQGSSDSRFDAALPPVVNTLPSKGVPSWRKPSGF